MGGPGARHELGLPLPPLVTADLVVFHSLSMWAMAVDVDLGEVRWKRKKEAGRGGVVLPGPDGTVLYGTEHLSSVRLRDGKVAWSTREMVAATATDDPGRVVVALRLSEHPATHVRDQSIAVRVELVDAATGAAVDGVDLDGVHRYGGDTPDVSDRLFRTAGGLLLSGLQDGRVRAFALDGGPAT